MLLEVINIPSIISGQGMISSVNINLGLDSTTKNVSQEKFSKK